MVVSNLFGSLFGTPLNNYIADFFKLYKDDILALHTKQFNEEDIYGYSDKIYCIGQYYLALDLVILIYLEYTNNGSTDWDYYKTKYKLVKNSKCLACNDIDLDKILKIFGLPFTVGQDCISGLESLEIEECFLIEPTTLVVEDKVTVDIKDLLAEGSYCTNYLN